MVRRHSSNYEVGSIRMFRIIIMNSFKHRKSLTSKSALSYVRCHILSQTRLVGVGVGLGV